MLRRQLSEEEQLRREAIAQRAAEHEESVIACALRDHMAARKLSAEVNPHVFGSYRFRLIAEAINALVEKNRPTSVIDVHEELVKRGTLDEVGGVGFIVELEESVATSAYFDYYLDKIKLAHTKRQLRKAAEAIIEAALDPDEEAPVNRAFDALLKVEDPRQAEATRHISDVIRSKVHEIETAYEAKKRGEEPPVAQTGFYDIDRKVVLTRGKLVILAARPAMGKTALAFNVAENVAKNTPVFLATLEMTGEELASRMIADELSITADAQAYGAVTDKQWDELVALADRHADSKLYIHDAPAANMAQIEAAAMILRAKLGEDLGLIAVDYLGLIDGEGENETAKIGKISRQGKQMAKRLGVPVMMLCQLSRAVESRDDKRPLMSDLRQSGAIEQDADVVMFIYRDEYYNPETTARGVAEVLLRKNRGGPIGTIELYFDGAKTRFSSVTMPFGLQCMPPDEEVTHGFDQSRLPDL